MDIAHTRKRHPPADTTAPAMFLIFRRPRAIPRREAQRGSRTSYRNKMRYRRIPPVWAVFTIRLFVGEENRRRFRNACGFARPATSRRGANLRPIAPIILRSRRIPAHLSGARPTIPRSPHRRPAGVPRRIRATSGSDGHVSARSIADLVGAKILLFAAGCGGFSV